MFDDIFMQTTSSAVLNLALKRIYNNKSELLLVLERPDIPLHNNGAENAIREYVKNAKSAEEPAAIRAARAATLLQV